MGISVECAHHDSMQSECRRVLAHYSIAPSRITLLQDERQRVFRIVDATSGKQFVLRIDPDASDRNRRALWSQCQWLRAIARDTDLIVPEPVANRQGELVTLIPGGCCTSMRWVPGRRRFWRHGPGAAVLREVGRVMARLHEHGQAFEPVRGFACPRWDWRDCSAGRHAGVRRCR